MRTIRDIGCFMRDYKREESGLYSKTTDAAMMEVVNLLAVESLWHAVTSILRFPVNGRLIVTAASRLI
jgi:hypothetical protein